METASLEKQHSAGEGWGVLSKLQILEFLQSGTTRRCVFPLTPVVIMPGFDLVIIFYNDAKILHFAMHIEARTSSLLSHY